MARNFACQSENTSGFLRASVGDVKRPSVTQYRSGFVTESVWPREMRLLGRISDSPSPVIPDPLFESPTARGHTATTLHSLSLSLSFSFSVSRSRGSKCALRFKFCVAGQIAWQIGFSPRHDAPSTIKSPAAWMSASYSSSFFLPLSLCTLFAARNSPESNRSTVRISLLVTSELRSSNVISFLSIVLGVILWINSGSFCWVSHKFYGDAVQWLFERKDRLRRIKWVS